MAPTASGSKNQGQRGAQHTISHFFSSGSTAGGTSGKRARSPVDLTLDSDEELQPPAKRVKSKETAVTQSLAAQSPNPESSMSQYSYGALDDSAGKTSAAEDAAANKKQAARRKLIRETLRQTMQPNGRDVQTRSSSIADDSEPAQSDSGEESDRNTPTKKLRAEFESNLSVNKRGSTKGKKGKTVEIGPSGEKYTPLELQVLQLKEENPGTLLMFEVGYKYCFYGEDARIASKALGIACFTKRNFLTGSIPVHRKSIHTKKLLSLGHRVGIVGQTETAALKKVGDNKSGPFTRQVTELYTAATFVDEMDSIDDVDAFGGIGAALVSLSESLMGGMGADERVKFGLVSVSPATGEVVYDEFIDTAMRSELETRLAHIKPYELLLPKSKLSKHSEKMLAHYAENGSVRVERVNEVLDYTAAFEFLQNFYQEDESRERAATSSSTFKANQPFNDVIGFPKPVVVALAHAVRYLISYGLSDAFKRTSFFTTFLTRSHMLLNANTLENLEIFQNQTDYTRMGSLIWILDRTLTRFGARQLRQWVSRPLVNPSILEERYQAVDEILQNPSAGIIKLRTLLKGLPDIVKGLCRIQYGKSNPKEVANVLVALSRVANTFDPIEKPEDAGFKSSLLNDIIFAMPRIREAVKGLLGDLNLKNAKEGEITDLWASPEKYPELEDVRFSILSVEMNMETHLKEGGALYLRINGCSSIAVRKALKRPSLKWVTVSDVEYLIEIPDAEKKKMPASWIRVQATKRVTRFHTPEARKAISERERYKETLDAVAKKAFSKFQAEINGYYDILRDVVNKLGVADALLSLTQVAALPGYIKPHISAGSELNIVQGRHPMVEAISSSPFVPNNVTLGGEQHSAMVITGPNMVWHLSRSAENFAQFFKGGKSSCVKMIALLVIMAQIGCYIPADNADISMHDAVLTRMGASDDIIRGRSTFMVEMSETAEIVRSATEKSLVILDELGRGTATYDGVAIASSVLEHTILHTKCKTLFITHYPQIGIELSQRHPNLVVNAHMAYMEEQLVDGRREIHFLYKLKKGIATRSFGVECGRLAGLPESVLVSAAKKSKELEEREHRTRLSAILKEIGRSVKSTSGSEASPETLKALIQKIKTVVSTRPE